MQRRVARGSRIRTGPALPALAGWATVAAFATVATSLAAAGSAQGVAGRSTARHDPTSQGIAPGPFSANQQRNPLGGEIYGALCARCHQDDGFSRAPDAFNLSMMPARSIFASLQTGTMREEAASLSDEEKRAVAEFLSGQPLRDDAIPDSARCGPEIAPASIDPIAWSGWGGSSTGRGYAADSAGLEAADVPRLELAWAFAVPDQIQTRSQPAVVGNQVIFGTQLGDVHSLDFSTGCLRWSLAAGAAVRGAMVVGDGPAPVTVYLADFSRTVFAVDALNGDLLWSAEIDGHPQNVVTGTPALHDGRLFVPLSSMEIVSAGRPEYDCCTSSGALVALSTDDGSELWRHRVIPEAAVEVGSDGAGRRTLAPAGAPVWSSPTIDALRGVVYIGTGENYTRPASTTSDSIQALDMVTGELRWSFQGTAGDAWNLSCGTAADANCPDPPGPDLDFGMAPMVLDRPEGRGLLVVGQKSGVVWALDPDLEGEVVWSRRIGRGGMLGGIHWGMATDGVRAFATNSDRVTGPTSEPASPGVFAIDLATGEELWATPPPADACTDRPGCYLANSAAPTAIPGVVFAGGLDGRVRAYASATGEILWDYDTVRSFETVNGVPGRGGAIDGPGPVVAHDTVFVNSGYALFGQMGGNVLLAFRVPDVAR